MVQRPWSPRTRSKACRTSYLTENIQKYKNGNDRERAERDSETEGAAHDRTTPHSHRIYCTHVYSICERRLALTAHIAEPTRLEAGCSRGRGYVARGRITPDSDGGRFVHVSALLDGEGSVQEGDQVRFKVSYDDRKGKDRAAEVPWG